MVRQITAQEGKMRRAPFGNQVAILAVADRAAHDQKQNLRQRVGHTPRLAWVFNGGKMVEKRLQARLLEPDFGG